jgi:hypothetical protein
LIVNYLEELSLTLERLDLSKDDICIVGSAVLAVYDVRKNNDIDIIVSPEHRYKVSKEHSSIKISENIECVSSNWLFKLDEKITDYDIIYDKTNHFKKHGFKFCNLELLKKRKQNSNKQKDTEDLILINDRR